MLRPGGSSLDQIELLTTARHERDSLGRTVQYTPPDHWESDSACEGWRVKDVLAHLASSDVAAAALVAEEEASELEEYRKSLDDESPSPDGWNDWAVARRRDEGPVALGLEWGRAADLLLTRAGAASDEEWNERQIPWVATDIRLKYLVQARVAEWWVHGEDIREGGRLPPRREHWPIFATCDLGIRLIPYWLPRSGHEGLGGRIVQFELEGVGAGTWRQSTSAGDSANEGKPNAYVEGYGYALASVAGGRADPDLTLYEGQLNIGGDVELATAVLHSIRSYP
jgi:uncharacterized protein (TIGR03083 family)